MNDDFFPRLGGRFDLAEKRRRLIHFHFVEMDMMEMLAGWSETMVWLPLRAGVGEHIWEQALHVDRLAWALRNLKVTDRWRRIQSPSDEFVRLLERIWQTSDPLLRVVGLYRVLKPHLAAAYEAYIEQSDPLADRFSVRTLQECLANHRRHSAWAEAMIGQLAETKARRIEMLDWQHALEAELLAAGGLLSEGASPMHLPFMGWPDTLRPPDAMPATPEDAAASGSGYTYRKGYDNRGSVELLWDARFRYAESPADLPDKKARSVDGVIAWLHGLFHGECQTVDRMGWLLVDFPELPWEMRKDMAQQAWEEARHIQIVAQLIEGLGGRLGMHPFAPYWGRLRRDVHHPVAHLVLGNVIGEGDTSVQTYQIMDYTDEWGNDWLHRGLEHLGADEVVHVGFGRTWARRLMLADPAKYKDEGLRQARAMLDTMEAAKRARGFETDATYNHAWERVVRRFERLSSADESAALNDDLA